MVFCHTLYNYVYLFSIFSYFEDHIFLVFDMVVTIIHL